MLQYTLYVKQNFSIFAILLVTLFKNLLISGVIMKNLKKILLICSIALCFCLLVGCGTSHEAEAPTVTEAPIATPEPTPTPAPITPEEAAASGTASLTTFSDYDEVFAAVQELQSVEETEAELSALCCALSDGDLTGSGTVCVSGELVYALSEKNLVIYRLSGETGELLSTTRVGTAWSTTTDDATGAFTGSEKTPLALFLSGTRLAVVLDVYGYEGTTGTIVYSEYVGVDIYDVSDAVAPVCLASFGQDGVFSDAWMSGGTLCLATKYSIYDAADASDTGAYVPALYNGAASSILDVSSLYAASFARCSGCAVFGVYSLDNASQTGAVAVYGTDADKVRTVSGSLFLTETCNISAPSRTMSDETDAYTEYAAVACTELYRFDYDASGLRLAASAVVNGVLSEDNAIAKTDTGYMIFSEQIGSYYNQYESGELVTTQELSGGLVCLLDDSLTCTAKLDALLDGSAVTWAGAASDSLLISGESASYTADAATLTISGETVGDPLDADVLFPWKDGGFAAFRQDEAGQMTLALYDASLTKTAERTFGSDFSRTLENLASYIALPEKNLLGFAADDSYCLYSEQNGEITFAADIFLTDWSRSARAIEKDARLAIIDTKEIILYDPDTLETVTTLTF